MRKTFLLVSLFSFFLDRLTKFLALKLLGTGPVSVFEGFFDLRFAENRGAAFSILSTAPELVRKFFLIVVPTFIIAYVLYYGLLKCSDRLTSISLGLIFGGALGNLYDRLLHGRVIDFLDFHIGSYHYPTFNLADLFIFVGICLLILKGFRGS